MASTQSNRRERIGAELRARLEVLRCQTKEQLAALPIAKTDATDIEGKSVKFTVFCEPQPDGSLLIAVRSDEPALLGLVTMGTTEGFLVTPGGQKVEAPEKLMREY